ncbi:hypothetical protein [Paraliobacillus ryukyuensis]|uniref:hypothetical protein n=1 Tax=Paraliobacillus ryukyuensis TaxID=200904 RepID=UPI0009A84611|nr:hypothetical protein [Paraliobacillus ryukyuensis]
MRSLELKIGQEWISDDNPHESFKIYDGIIDTCVDAFKDETLSFDEQPESTKIFFWERINREAFNDFIDKVKGKDSENTYPYAWCGESRKATIVNKIKNNNMILR